MEYNGDFRWDLKVGQLAEQLLADILSSKTVEVKRDFKASRTGKVFVEFFSRGKDSGIATTEADYWAFVVGEETIIIMPTDKLKIIVQEDIHKGKVVSGGDRNTSQGVLVKIERLVV